MKRIILFSLLAASAFAQAKLAAFSNGKALGNPQAPIRIELFSDYQCPACKQLHDETIAPLINNYVNTGKVYLVRREFPLPIHAHAMAAARIACAAEQMGKYQQVCDQMFRTQDSWTASGDVLGAACSVLSPADAKKLRELVSAAETAQAVESDLRLGGGEKLNGTPTMIITKVVRRYPVPGPVSYSVLSRFLDSL